MSEATLYLWAREITLGEFDEQLVIDLDHTWVTDYPAGPNGLLLAPLNGNYWYCWGTLHSADDQYENPSPNTPFRVTTIPDLGEAKCICEPNVQKDGKDDTNTWPHAFIPGGYAEHGVCHQVANRILWSAGVPEWIANHGGRG